MAVLCLGRPILRYDHGSMTLHDPQTSMFHGLYAPLALAIVENTDEVASDFLVPEWFIHTENKLLLLALMLTLWLWLLVRRREEETRRPSRPSPVTPEELARIAFLAAKQKDLNAYRVLFLTGKEAVDTLGSEASSYMENRSFQVLKQSFGMFAGQISQDCSYAGVKELEGDNLGLMVQGDGSEPFMVPLGRLTKVGNIYRIFTPPPD